MLILVGIGICLSVWAVWKVTGWLDELRVRRVVNELLEQRLTVQPQADEPYDEHMDNYVG